MIIPAPKKCNKINNDFVFCPCNIATNRSDWKEILTLFSNTFEKIFETKADIRSGGIELIFDRSLKVGSYSIDTDDGVRVSASDREGILYGIASLLQIICVEDGRIKTERVCIEDYPDKSYRGFMVDLGRQWHSAEKLLKYIDICFLYKIKYLHLHFTDNLICTLPSKKYPKIASKNKSYSVEELKILNEYAENRGVVIIPEIEGPGHSEQLIYAYPKIFGNRFDGSGKGGTVSETGAVIDGTGLICAGSAVAVDAVKDIIKELCEIFPDAPYIHIGGDEADIEKWNDCPVCRQYMKDNNIKNEKELYSDYIAGISKFCLENGKTPIVWEGFPKEGASKIPKETIVIAWESYYQSPKDLLEEGFRVINSSWQPLYIVPSITERWNPLDILDWNVYNWQHWWSESLAYKNPINVEPTGQVMGAVMCAWEQTFEQEVNFVMENLASVSERTWNEDGKPDKKQFLKSLARLSLIAAKVIG